MIITFETWVHLGLTTCILLDALCKLTLYPQFKTTPVTVEGICEKSGILVKWFPFFGLGNTT